MVTHMKEEQTHHIQLLAEKVKEQSRQHEEQNRQIEEQNRQIEEQSRQIEEQNRQIEELSMKLQSKDEEIEIENKKALTSEPQLLIMNQFEHHKKNSRDWYSMPFYTHHRGYRMCVQIYANGFGEVQGSHASLYTCIMKGEYDDELSWPFHGKITVKLLNQNADKDHYVCVFSYAKDCDYGCRVTIGEKNYGWGHSNFISHSELNQDSDSAVQYLRNDCLKFQLYCTVYQ